MCLVYQVKTSCFFSTHHSLSAIENRGNDLKISTMKKYVEAMGGKLRIDVELPTGKHIGFTV
ncbi:ATP-binding protein [Acinetobacter baumannii]|uniref:ATP-binding protein n=2 Tax=Acinetobacter baumannii TaxID=470 RepID=A0A5N5XU50_ACIBA|nr:ATP-binding protein [Acinetobacter baumannii]AYX98590.1 ATP-binding protein [Acinetobacter sp. FDAARGOS_493]EJG28236.1 toxin-antitoxin system, antitoxin component, Xre domain protein [Acinetobacter baumannii Naval-17]EJO37657.1 hypothetical protein ACINIS123_C0015 [Acinetobacter baumannii IS-123]EJP56713.1 toxin-antitoxin system, antitoxin component, Xre domain protein [Acinetobacter baumannii Naval-81]ETR81501.1 hypothetical protein M212_4263 [Acinetobacter baumannii CI79]KLT76443.1 toxin